jgi:hypothetical protein
MTTVLCIMAAFMVLMFLLLGGVIGYLTRDFMFAQAAALPQHPEFYDAEGNIIPDDILAIRFENSYGMDDEWDDED